MDVTTLRTTPTSAMTVGPLPTVARVNGGVLRMSFSWRRPRRRAIPNRWLSASRYVGLSSIRRRERRLVQADLPPPRAQENMRGKARPVSRASAEMGRSTDADGERERARASPSNSLHRRLDRPCFIDGTVPPKAGQWSIAEPVHRQARLTSRVDLTVTTPVDAKHVLSPGRASMSDDSPSSGLAGRFYAGRVPAVHCSGCIR